MEQRATQRQEDRSLSELTKQLTERLAPEARSPVPRGGSFRRRRPIHHVSISYTWLGRRATS
jgi:hypothetical protein